MKERKKPEKFLLPHGRPSDDRSFAFSSRVLSKAAKIKALINYGIISSPGDHPASYGERPRARRASRGLHAARCAAPHSPRLGCRTFLSCISKGFGGFCSRLLRLR